MKITNLKLNGSTITCKVNGSKYIGTFEMFGKYCGVTYLRNELKEKQTTMQIKVAVGVEIDKILGLHIVERNR